ncbi:MAG: hypothetical protein KGJ84_03225, partial [Elusimicrobia bacterium]|nr:hypothetical protein [Elusimicrobiota bacterium]
MKFLLAALVVLASACRKAPEAAKEEFVPTKAVVAGERLIDFDGKAGDFSCRAPAEWKTVEDDYSGGPLVMFFGPAAGARRGTASIGVSRYPAVGDKIKTPDEFLTMLKLTDRNPSALTSRSVDGRMVYEVHYEVPQRAPQGHKILYMNRADAAMIPCKGGFYLISHTAPADAYQA